MLSILVLLLVSLVEVSRGYFSIVETTVGGKLDARIIQNDDTGEYVEVIVDYGGLVEDLLLRSHSTGRGRRVLLTHHDNATAVEENTWWQGMLLLPWANRVAYGRYEFFDSVYHLPLNEISVDPPRVNALHGFMDGKKMVVTDTESTSNFARLQLSCSFNQPLPGYPFDFDVSIDYFLSDTGFHMTFYITNTMESTPMPFYMGWHPYFLCFPYKAYVVLDPCTAWNHVELNENMGPTGATAQYFGFNGTEPIGGTISSPTFYDDEFKPIQPKNRACRFIVTKLHDDPTEQTVVLWQDSSFRFVHVFTGREGAIAIEPMSGMADAYNNHDHLSVLSGGETWSGAVGIYIE
jgi:aldose 1-epimerase